MRITEKNMLKILTFIIARVYGRYYDVALVAGKNALLYVGK